MVRECIVVVQAMPTRQLVRLCRRLIDHWGREYDRECTMIHANRMHRVSQLQFGRVGLMRIIFAGISLSVSAALPELAA